MPGGDARRAGAVGPVSRYADGFATWLAGQGFTAGTVSGYLRWLGWLSGWLAARGLGADAVTDRVAEAFAADMREAGHPKITSGRLARMMSYLRSVEAVPQAGPAPLTERQQMLAEFASYLQADRGLGPGTVTERVRVAVRSGGPRARRRCSPLRSFLRFLQMTGHAGQDLAIVLPAVRKTAGTRRGVRLTPAEASTVLAAADGLGEQGLRERAVLLLADRLGLRASEVSWLSLDDIGWRAGIISIRRKGGRRAGFPLTADAGQALADYLTARPAVPGTRAVF